MPSFVQGTVEHTAVTCDGCGVSPLVGPRFKCETCTDYDLCGECFAKRASVHGGDAADHSFKCIMLPEAMPDGRWAAKAAQRAFKAAKMAFKGKGKGNGDCKGMCRGSRRNTSTGACDDPMSEEAAPRHHDASGVGRPCAGGCGFRATWHA